MAALNAADFSAVKAFGGEYEQKLFSNALNNLDVVLDCSLDDEVSNSKTLTKLTITGEPMPYSDSDDSKAGDLKYEEREIKVFPWKREMNLDPESYRATWQQVNKRRQKGGKEIIPFAKFVWQQFMKSIFAKLNNNTAFNGKRDKTKKFAINIANGFNTIIKEEITAGKLIPTVTGAITVDNVIESIQAVYDNLPEELRNEGGIEISVSDRVDKLYRAAYREKFGKYTGDQNNMELLDRPGVFIKKRTWMNGSQRIIATRSANMVVGSEDDPKKVKLEIQKIKFKFWVGVQGVIGFQFRDLWELSVNDQE